MTLTRLSELHLKGLQIHREKVKRVHAKSKTPLTVNTLAPLHRFPWQQSTLQLTSPFGPESLQSSDFFPLSHWILVAHPLANTAADICPLVPSTLYLPQRSAKEGHSFSVFISAQSSQPFVETHSYHLRPYTRKYVSFIRTSFIFLTIAK